MIMILCYAMPTVMFSNQSIILTAITKHNTTYIIYIVLIVHDVTSSNVEMSLIPNVFKA